MTDPQPTQERAPEPHEPESAFRTAWHAVQFGILGYFAIALIVMGLGQALGR